MSTSSFYFLRISRFLVIASGPSTIIITPHWYIFTATWWYKDYLSFMMKIFQYCFDIPVATSSHLGFIVHLPCCLVFGLSLNGGQNLLSQEFIFGLLSDTFWYYYLIAVKVWKLCFDLSSKAYIKASEFLVGIVSSKDFTLQKHVRVKSGLRYSVAQSNI